LSAYKLVNRPHVNPLLCTLDVLSTGVAVPFCDEAIRIDILY
jgi:hypothetical protein